VKVKKIDWEGPFVPGEHGISYDHVMAHTPIGKLSISWKSWKDSPSYCSHDYPDHMPFFFGDTLDEVKDLIQGYFNELILSMIEDD